MKSCVSSQRSALKFISEIFVECNCVQCTCVCVCAHSGTADWRSFVMLRCPAEDRKGCHTKVVLCGYAIPQTREDECVFCFHDGNPRDWSWFCVAACRPPSPHPGSHPALLPLRSGLSQPLERRQGLKCVRGGQNPVSQLMLCAHPECIPGAGPGNVLTARGWVLELPGGFGD